MYESDMLSQLMNYKFVKEIYAGILAFFARNSTGDFIAYFGPIVASSCLENFMCR